MATPSGVIRVPATSANLGPGFDCMAVAMDLWCTVKFHVDSGAGLSVTVHGRDPDQISMGPDNLILQSAAKIADESFVRGLQLELQSDVPIGRGLGSSATAVAAGLLLGTALANQSVDLAKLLRVGCDIEGHADNIGACLYGGLGLCSRNQYLAIPIPPSLSWLAWIPKRRTSTEESRGTLPDSYSRADMVRQIHAVAGLLTCLHQDRLQDLRKFLTDRVHEPVRGLLVPELDAMKAIDHPQLLGATLSGSGPTVLGWVEGNSAEVMNVVGESLGARFEGELIALRGTSSGSELSLSEG